MADAVSTLYRLAEERSSVVTYCRDGTQDRENLWVVRATMPLTTTAENSATDTQGIPSVVVGTGRARKVKQAKQYAAKHLLSQLAPSATPLSNVVDRMQYLLDRHNKQVLFKGQSKGETLPQRYRMELFVGGNTEPIAVSDWLVRRDAIKQVLQKAFVELKYVQPSADVLNYNMVVEGAEEDEDEIREGLGKDDVGEIREGPPLMLGPLHIPRDSFSSAPGFDERPSEENGADIHRYLIQRFNKANFTVESYGMTLPLLWKYELFLNNSTVPYAISEWLPPAAAKRSSLLKAFALLGSDLQSADVEAVEPSDTERSSQSDDDGPSTLHNRKRARTS